MPERVQEESRRELNGNWESAYSPFYHFPEILVGKHVAGLGDGGMQAYMPLRECWAKIAKAQGQIWSGLHHQ